MSQAPQPLRISLEDYPDAPEWFADFARRLNQYTDDVTAALTKGTTLSENGAGEYVERTLNTGAAVAADSNPFPLYFTPSFAQKPQHFSVSYAKDKTSNAALTLVPAWEWDGKLVVLRYLSGLSTNKEYLVRFRLEP